MNSLISTIGFSFIIMIAFLMFVQPPTPPARFSETIKPWPPKVGKPYPDLELIDQDGRVFHLSDYKGRVILLQPVGISSSASQALSGAQKSGIYKNVPLQEGLSAIDITFPQYTKGLKFPNEDVIFLQILFYGMNLQKPTQKDATDWASHFGFNVSENQIVAVSPHDLRSDKTYTIIPGFHLIDKNFILQADASGPQPKDDLFKTLLPMVPIAINAERR